MSDTNLTVGDVAIRRVTYNDYVMLIVDKFTSRGDGTYVVSREQHPAGGVYLSVHRLGILILRDRDSY
jgi:hypothetical protein